MLGLRHLQASRFKSTESVNDILTRLSEVSGWPDNVLSRLAISRSLQVPKIPDQVQGKRKGKELRGETFFKASKDTDDPDYLPWMAAMIAQHLGRTFRGDDEAEALVDAHWHRGARLLAEDIDACNGDFNEVVLELIRDAATRLPVAAGQSGSLTGGGATLPSGQILPITIPIGRTSPDSP